MSGSKLFRGPFTKHSENVAIADTGDYEGLLTIEDSEGRVVYQVFGDDEQDEINADFVLRALNCHEDLLAACKEAIAVITDYVFKEPNNLPQQPLLGKLNLSHAHLGDAITKAEGRT